MLRTTTRHRRSVVGGLLALLALLTTGVPAAHAQGGTDPAEAWYTTDFSNPSAAAVEWQFPNGQTTETGKGYTLAITPGEFIVGLDGIKSVTNLWLSPDVAPPPTDQIVEATFTAIEGGKAVYAGVVCRGSVDDDLGYGFVVAKDGYFSIGAYAGKGFRRLAESKSKRAYATLDPTGPNTLRAECTNAGKSKVRLELFVDDEQVASVIDRKAPATSGRDAYLLTEADGGKPGQVTYSSFSITPA